MRVVLKPGGLLIVVASISVLGFLAFRNVGNGGGEAPPKAMSATATASGGLIGDGVSGFAGPPAGLGTLTTVAAEGKPGGNTKALRLSVTGKPKDRWEVQASRDILAPVTEKQVLTLSFWARSPNSGRVTAVFEKSAEPFTKALERELPLTPKWKEYRLAFTTPAYKAGGAGVRFQTGFSTGNVVEVAGVRLETGDRTARSSGGTAPSVAPGGDLLAAGGGDWLFSPGPEGTPPCGTATEAAPADLPTGAAGMYRHVTVTKKPADAWGVYLDHPIGNPVAAGRALRLHFWARSKAKTPFHAIVEQTLAPNEKALDRPVAPGPEWKEYAFPFKSPAYGPAEAHVTFHLGGATGEVEIAGARLEDHGANVPLPPAVNAGP